MKSGVLSAFHHHLKAVYVGPWTCKIQEVICVDGSHLQHLFCCFFLCSYLGLHVEFSVIIHWGGKIPSLVYIYSGYICTNQKDYHSTHPEWQIKGLILNKLSWRYLLFIQVEMSSAGLWVWILGRRTRFQLHLEEILKNKGRQNPTHPFN